MTSPPEPTAAVAALFGERLGAARRFAELLATDGIARGLLGPREVPRIWDRHLANCAVLSELLPQGVRVVDVGSGAGLPGLVLALCRPDLRVDLVESLQRRTEFLSTAAGELEVTARVRVVRGRAEDAAVVALVGDAEWVTARAVAPLDRLVGWCLPLLRPGGRLLAVKGATADSEVAQHAATVRRYGGTDVGVVRCGVGVLADPTSVVTVTRTDKPLPRRRGRR